MDLLSVKNYGQMREYRSIRKVWTKGATHAVDHEFVVRATNGPEAANMINFLVAEDYDKFAPKSPGLKNEKKNNKKKQKIEE